VSECMGRHVFSKWVQGARTKKWFRTCGYCGATERSDTQPPDPLPFSKFVPPAILDSRIKKGEK
jgi:hypothetical protein